MGGLPVKPKLQGYVAQELFDEFEAYRASHNLNQSKALEKLLAEYFGKPSAPSLPFNDVITTSALVNSLRAELAALRLELVQRLELVESRLANESALPLSESAANLVDKSALVEDVIAVPVDVSAISSADGLADESASESVAEEEAIAPTAENPHLTRDQLGKQFKVSRESIRKWEESGKLAEKGWERVPRSGTSPKNPHLYRPVV